MPRLTGHIRVQENPALTFDAPHIMRHYLCREILRLLLMRLRLDAPPFGCALKSCASVWMRLRLDALDITAPYCALSGEAH